MNVSLPFKVMQAARVALDDAKASGKRFETAKFALQQKVLTAWFDLALTTEKIRIQTENINLLKMTSEIAAQRVGAGAAQQDLLKAQAEYEMGLNELANMRTEQATTIAMLNGMMARRPDAPLEAPGELPRPRPLAADDSQLIALAVEGNPELAALAQEVKSKGGSVDLAKLGYVPDFSASISVRGNIEQNLGAMIMWPANLGKVNAEIEEARAMLKRSEAMARQTRSDRWSQFAVTLYALRNNERQIGLFRDSILPKSQQAWENSIKAYSAGTVAFSDLIDAQRLLLQVRLLVAEARMGREKRLAELETMAGTDVETLTRAATPASQPATIKPAGGPYTHARESKLN
jgi:outer membrane protein TolC